MTENPNLFPFAATFAPVPNQISLLSGKPIHKQGNSMNRMRFFGYAFRRRVLRAPCKMPVPLR